MTEVAEMPAPHISATDISCRSRISCPTIVVGLEDGLMAGVNFIGMIAVVPGELFSGGFFGSLIFPVFSA